MDVYFSLRNTVYYLELIIHCSSVLLSDPSLHSSHDITTDLCITKRDVLKDSCVNKLILLLKTSQITYYNIVVHQNVPTYIKSLVPKNQIILNTYFNVVHRHKLLIIFSATLILYPLRYNWILQYWKKYSLTYSCKLLTKQDNYTMDPW